MSDLNRRIEEVTVQSDSSSVGESLKNIISQAIGEAIRVAAENRIRN